MKTKIYYTTAYDNNNTVCGYVLADYDTTKDAYIITQRQYNNALKRRTIGGNAGIIFQANKTVLINDNGALY